MGGVVVEGWVVGVGWGGWVVKWGGGGWWWVVGGGVGVVVVVGWWNPIGIL